MRPEGFHSSEGSDGSDRSVGSSHQTLRAHGGYRMLRSFRAAEAVYDATVVFCERFVSKRSRTHDQMVQAARSGRQNIAEGSRASGTSSQIELRLVGVARASLDELLLDYEDVLRQRRLPRWDKADPQAMQVRALGREGAAGLPFEPYRRLVETGAPETAANSIICLIHQANFLLDRQIQALEQQFIREGGYSEQLARARREARRADRTDRTDRTDRSDQLAPACPLCGQPMQLRVARRGPRAGQSFWGCSRFPDCTGTRAG